MLDRKSKGSAGATARRTARFTALAAACALPFAAHAATTIYTLDADFDLGVLSGVNHGAPNNNQLQLNTIGTTFPVLWVANAGEDTLSKIDTNTGRELARYRTGFGNGPFGNHGAFAGPAPSRSAVDINGNAYILNRHFDGRVPVLMKVLTEGFIDRNGNGSADTSIDANNSGTITFDETKPLVDSNGNGIVDPNEIQDERVVWASRIQLPTGPSEAGALGRAMCIGTDGNLWIGMFNTQRYYKVSAVDGSILSGPHSVPWQPYGCLVDRNGILWSASLSGRLGRLDTGTPASTAAFDDASQNYGIALGNGKVYLGAISAAFGFRQFDPLTNQFSTPGGSKGFVSTGISVDGAGAIWTGSYNGGGVRKYDKDAGTELCAGASQSNSETRGVIVDADNNVWQINRFSNSISKYRGTDCAPLGVFPVGFDPYTYSDATGFAARNITTPTGTWTVTKDGGTNGQAWNRVSWTDQVPAGASVQVSVRADDSAANLPNLTFVPVANGANPGVTGRFIQVQARLNANANNDSPILLDLTLATPDAGLVCDADRDGDIDSNDIALITAARGQRVQPGDPRDLISDGLITVNDARGCALRCTRPNCATQSAVPN
jgi:hypothetical protein